MNISFIGGGVMAEAIIGGILDSKLATPQQIHVAEPIAARRSQLTERHQINVTPTNTDFINECDLVVLSVKPQQIPEVMKEISPTLDQTQTILSIVAGVNINTLSKGLNHTNIVRVMPNTPAQVRAGMTVWTASSTVTNVMLDMSRSILRTLGKEIYVEEENLIDMATALSASGPAYVFVFIEAMIDAGVNLGMKRDMASQLVLQTVRGSTELQQTTNLHPAELRNMVTSPGDTTADALAALERAGFRRAVLDAVIAAYEKSRKLGNSN